MALARNRIVTGLIAVVLVHSTVEGSLQDREKEITERSEAKKSESSDNTHHYRSHAGRSAFGSGTYPSSRGGDGFFAGVWAWLVAAPFQYRYDDPATSMSDGDDWAAEDDPIFLQHASGQATMPTVRLDYNYQFDDNDVSADVHDGRLELGYKFFAFHGRMTKYRQVDGFTLDLRQYYGVLRYGGYRPDFLPGTFEVAIGAGVVHHTGDVKDDTSSALTLPLKYHPTDWFGFEFRPAWYRWQEISIGDYDLSASLGVRTAQLRAGYRWIWDNGIVDEQSGPYLGASLSF